MGGTRGAGCTEPVGTSTARPRLSNNRVIAPVAGCFPRQYVGDGGDRSWPISCPPSPSISLPAFLIHIFLARPHHLRCIFVFSSLITQITAQRRLPAGSEHPACEQASLPVGFSLPAMQPGNALILRGLTCCERCPSLLGEFWCLGTREPAFLKTSYFPSEPGGFISLYVQPCRENHLLSQVMHLTDPREHLRWVLGRERGSWRGLGLQTRKGPGDNSVCESFVLLFSGFGVLQTYDALKRFYFFIILFFQSRFLLHRKPCK